jgi:hypothetical protein
VFSAEPMPRLGTNLPEAQNDNQLSSCFPHAFSGLVQAQNRFPHVFSCLVQAQNRFPHTLSCVVHAHSRLPHVLSGLVQAQNRFPHALSSLVHAQNRFPHPFSLHREPLSPFGDRVVSKRRQNFAFGISDFLLLETALSTFGDNKPRFGDELRRAKC